MANFDTDHLRNVVLLSHSGAGKTMLVEAMLNAAGVTSRLGKTEEGTTVSDYEPEEAKRAASIQTSILPCPWREHKINIIDTPGYADYRGEVVSGLRVADGAILAVAGPSGVEVGTQQMWKMANESGLPRLIVVTKMDRENADFQRVMDSLVESFGRQCVAIQLPIGSEAQFSGTVNLLDPEAEVPSGLEEAVESARERLTEAAAESDDDLANKYLEGEPLSSEEMIRGLKQGQADGAIVPVMVSAAEAGIGAVDVLDRIVDFLPSPQDRTPGVATSPSNGEEVTIGWDSNGPLAALVFKTSADTFVGKLSYLKVFSGTLKADSQLWNATRNESVRVAQLLVVRGKSQEAVQELAPGDIGAVAKITSVLTGDTFSDKDMPLHLAGLSFPEPVCQMAAYPKSKADLDKMSNAMARITEEDSTLSITREPNTHEILLGGLGDTHLEVAVEKMQRKFGVEILLQTPKVPYMESVNSQARAEYRHKKQSGGHGQFAHVFLEIEPLSRGSGFQFDQKVVGGSVPREYIPSVEKGCNKALEEGVLGGYPIVDLKATLVDGSFHPVDSSGVSFEIAGGHALTDGIKEAGPILLEPIMRIAVAVPEQDTGDVMGDLNGRRARILGMMPQEDGTTVIEAEIPQAEVLRYAVELRSQTQGRGAFSVQFDHYDEVPGHLVQGVVAKQEKEKVEAGA